MHEDSLYGRPIGIEPRSCSVIYNVNANNTARTPPLTTARAAQVQAYRLAGPPFLALGNTGGACKMAVEALASWPFIPNLSLSAAVGLSTVHPMLLKISLILQIRAKGIESR